MRTIGRRAKIVTGSTASECVDLVAYGFRHVRRCRQSCRGAFSNGEHLKRSGGLADGRGWGTSRTARRMALDADAIAEVLRLTYRRLVRTHFARGYDELAKTRRESDQLRRARSTEPNFAGALEHCVAAYAHEP